MRLLQYGPLGRCLEQLKAGAARAQRRLTAAPAVAIVLSVAALFVTACGGSSSMLSTSSSTPTTTAAGGGRSETKFGSSTKTTGVGHGGGGGTTVRGGSNAGGHAGSRPNHQASGHDVVTRGVVTHRPVAGTGGAVINDDNPKQQASQADSGKEPVTQSNPCALVSKTDAETLIGEPIAVPRVAPLGPTCIYQPMHGKNSITLSVESVNFSQIKPHMRKVTRFSVRGHVGYCGNYGRTMTFVPLPNGKVLNVTAPCSVGAPLAARAVARLAA